jgi:hypothetical protein
MHADGLRIEGFLLDTPYVLLTGKLPLPKWLPEGVQPSIEMMGACMLSNARAGVWIACMCIKRIKELITFFYQLKFLVGLVDTYKF